MKTTMITKVTMAAGLTLVMSGCGANNDAYVAQLTDALGRADVTLIDAVNIAETEAGEGAGLRGRLLLKDTNHYAVRAFGQRSTLDVDIDLSGTVTSALEANLESPCEGTIALDAALAIAEQEAGGTAVAAVPDDDVDCAFEIQVLIPGDLWEVKVGPNGDVLESEASDEGSGEDD